VINNAEPAPTDGPTREELLEMEVTTLRIQMSHIAGCARTLIEGMRPAGESGYQVLVLTSDLAKLAHAIKKASEPQ